MSITYITRTVLFSSCKESEGHIQVFIDGIFHVIQNSFWENIFWTADIFLPVIQVFFYSDGITAETVQLEGCFFFKLQPSLQ